MAAAGAGEMKRAREEEHGAPTASRRRRNPTPAAPPADRPPTVPAYDALRYVASVKREFAGEPEKHEEFLAVLRQFRLGSLDVASTMDRLQVVFHGHADLIRGFNVFMPSKGGLKEEQGGDGEA